MSKLVTGTAAVVVAVMMLHGQRTATSQPSAFFPETSIWRVSMGPDPGGNSGAQFRPSAPREPIAWWIRPASASSNDDEAEYQQERRACESLAGDARNHCVEYAKLRYGRS
jgi:hypothetical protein